MRRESGSLIPLDILKTMTLNGAFWRILRIGLQLQREREREREREKEKMFFICQN